MYPGVYFKNCNVLAPSTQLKAYGLTPALLGPLHRYSLKIERWVSQAASALLGPLNHYRLKIELWYVSALEAEIGRC